MSQPLLYNPTRKRKVILDAKSIGRRIAEGRRMRTWKQKHLAEALGVKENTIANWEGGHRVPERDTLVALAIHLRRSIDWLLTGVERRGSIFKLTAK